MAVHMSLLARRRRLAIDAATIRARHCLASSSSVPTSADASASSPAKKTTTTKTPKKPAWGQHTKKSDTIMIFASEVPVIAALNPYRKIEDVFFDVWKRTQPQQIAMLQHELQLLLPTPAEKVQAIVEELGVAAPIASLVKEAAVAESAKSVVAATAKIAATLPASTPTAVKQEVVQFLASEMHKSFGAKHEAPALAHYEQQQRVTVRERNVAFSKKQLTTLGGFDVFVGGKIDGKAAGKVVEVKNRMKRFMTPLPAYDVAQLQTYLFILGLREGELVEHLRGSNGNGSDDGNDGGSGDASTTKLTKVDWDARMWETQIEPFVLRFSSALVHFMRSREAQTSFLMGEADERREIVRTHWSRDLPL